MRYELAIEEAHFSYQNACNTRCDLNYEFDAFVVRLTCYLVYTNDLLQWVLNKHEKSFEKENRTNEAYELTYPRALIDGDRMPLAMNFFNLTIDADYELKKNVSLTNIESAHTINLWLLLDGTDEERPLITVCQLVFSKQFKRGFTALGGVVG